MFININNLLTINLAKISKKNNPKIDSLKIFFLLVLIFFSHLSAYSFIKEGELDFYHNPEKMFRGFVYEAEEISPSFIKKHFPLEWRVITKTRERYDNIAKNAIDKRFTLSTSLTSDLLSFFNYYFNAQVLRENIFIPELKIGVGHLFYLPVYSKLLSRGYYKTILDTTKFQSLSGSVILAKSTLDNVKFFAGYRYNYSALSLTISPIEGNPEKKVDTDWHMHTAIVGINYLADNSYWEISSYMGYTFSKQDFYLKLEGVYKNISLGVGFYPSNTVIFRPYLKFIISI